MSNIEIRFDLVGNARDSFRQAVAAIAFPEGDRVGRYKRAIVNAAHCAELILKERLRRVHPAFVWKNVDKYPSLSAFTVSAGEALSRLERIGGLSFDESDKKALSSCRKIRNAIEHYEFSVSQREAKVVLGQVLSFIIGFAREEIKLELEAELRDDDTWISLVYELLDFAKSYEKVLWKRLAEEDRLVVECPTCGCETLDVYDSTCAMCGHLSFEDEEAILLGESNV